VADVLSGLSLLHLTKLNKRKKAGFTAGEKKLARNRKSTKRRSQIITHFAIQHNIL
jgi:hypothetical protein